MLPTTFMTSSAPKRVLIFTTAYFPHVGGAEVAVREITDRLGDDYEFHLICAKYTRLPATERIGKVTVHRVGWGIRVLDKFASPFLGAARALSLGRFDLYWAVMATYGSGGAYIARWFTKVPVVLTLQEGDPPEYIRRKWFGLLGLSWRLALAHSAAVTVISTYLGTLAKEFGYRGAPVLIPNGVDGARFTATSPTSHEGTVLVTTSRLVHKNAVDDVIRALALLPQEVSFVVYGVGPDEVMLRRLAEREGVAARVHFKGQIDHAALPEALAACDIFIRPSRSEGMGNSFVEAMAAGLPVIATQEGGLSDFIFDATKNPDKEPTAWAVAKDMPQEIAAAVEAIRSHPDATQATVANARAMVHEKYDWNLIAGRMQDLLRALIS